MLKKVLIFAAVAFVAIVVSRKVAFVSGLFDKIGL